MIMELYVVFFTLMFFAILCLGTLISLLKRKGWLFAFIPLTLFVVISVMYTYTDLLGKPTEKDLPEEFFLVHHYAVEDEKVIYLWVTPSGETIPVAHVVPYTAELQETLDGLKQTTEEEGSSAMIRGFKPKDDDTATEFELFYFVQQKYLRKDGNPVQ